MREGCRGLTGSEPRREREREGDSKQVLTGTREGCRGLTGSEPRREREIVNRF